VSYCRFAWNGSDVYVYEHCDGGFECCGCKLHPKGPWRYDTLEDMIYHLAQHKKAGHFVPFYAIKGLWFDIEGPNKSVHPEPKLLTDTRRKMKQIMKEIRKKKKDSNSEAGEKKGE